MTTDLIIEQAEQLQSAIEDYNRSLSLARSVALPARSVALESYSLKVALEAEVEQKRKGIFARLLDFFKSLWDRWISWADKRIKRFKDARTAKDQTEEVSKDLSPTKEERDSVKAASGKVAENLHRDSHDKLVTALANEAFDLIKSPEFLQQHFKTVMSDYAVFCAAYKQSEYKVLEMTVRLLNTLRNTIKLLQATVDHAKRGRTQVQSMAEQLSDSVQSLTQQGRALAEEVQRASTYQPEHLLEIFTAILDKRYAGVINAQFEDNKIQIELDIMASEIEPLIDVFNEIKQSDPDNLHGVAASIYDLTPATLSMITSAPAHLMGAAGRIDTIRTQVVPATTINARAVVRKAISVASQGKTIHGIADSAALLVMDRIITQAR